MRIKKVAYAALLLSLSMSVLACVPANKSSAYDEDKESPIKVIDSHQVNRAYFTVFGAPKVIIDWSGKDEAQISKDQ